jgi:hypothetical protein
MHTISKHLGVQLKDEKPLLAGLGSGFDQSKEFVNKVMSNMDGMLNRASGSMLPYIILFTIILLSLIYKF